MFYRLNIQFSWEDIDIDKTVHLVERVDGGQQPIRRSQESAVEQRRDHRKVFLFESSCCNVLTLLGVSKSEPLFRSTFHVPIGENGIPDLNRVGSTLIANFSSSAFIPFGADGHSS